MAALDLDLQVHLGRRRNIPAHAPVSKSVHSEKKKDIQGLRWCPDPVAFVPLQFFLLIFY